jgi:uncharacterized membrane protein
MFLILLLAWILKTTTTNLPTNAAETRLVQSFGEWVGNSAIGPLPGALVILGVALFYGWIVVGSLRVTEGKGELAHGDVHV